jgi:hypothetical protein
LLEASEQVLAASEDTHFRLDAAHSWVELQQGIPLVNAKTEEQTQDDHCPHTRADREYPREQRSFLPPEHDRFGTEGKEEGGDGK